MLVICRLSLTFLFEAIHGHRDSRTKFLSVTTSMIISALKSGFGRDALEMSRKINVSANL